MSDEPDFLELGSTKEEVEPTPEPTPEVVSEVGIASPVVTFRGNSYDLTAVVAVTIGGVVLLTCATCNLGYYCLPFVPIILGIFGLVSAKDSVDPERTRLLSWIGLGSGAAILLLICLAIVAYIGFIFFAIASLLLH